MRRLVLLACTGWLTQVHGVYYSVTLGSLQPRPSDEGTCGTAQGAALTSYNGPASAFPDRQHWMRFDLLFDRYRPGIAQFPKSEPLVSLIRRNLLRVSKTSGVDARLLLAVMMQANNGRLYDAEHPSRSIYEMLRDGAAGTGATDVCLANYINVYGNFWDALAVYNQGAAGANLQNLSDPSCCTKDYVSKIANRVQGWTDDWIVADPSSSASMATSMPQGNDLDGIPGATLALAAQSEPTVPLRSSATKPWASATHPPATVSRATAAGNVMWALSESIYYTDVHWYEDTHTEI